MMENRKSFLLNTLFVPHFFLILLSNASVVVPGTVLHGLETHLSRS